MPEIGQAISHYRIAEKLGQGGMGVVYKAEDTSLDRKVALKFLPDIFSGDPERLARFEREAKLLASLNHPNIATIYGLEQADGKRFLAMELVEGETLAQQIDRGPLPVDEALEVCRQIAEGLEAAHERGIIHRDLKPANVKISPEGKVKILDFGLAKALQEQVASVDSPTISEMTRPGVLLGTAAYMSPEQAKGKPVDKRADIWAFGCILYECLTAKRVFQGETVADTLARILEGTPDWGALPAKTPTITRQLLRWCLQKDLQRRLRDVADARVAIEEALSQPLTPEPAERSRATVAQVVIALILVFGLGGVATTLVTRHLLMESTPALQVVRSVIDLPPGMQLTRERRGPARTEIALSADGRNLVYGASPDGSSARTGLYLRALDVGEAKLIHGTEGARIPFFSPDGQWIGFWANRKLQKVPLSGGIPITLCDSVEVPMGASWSRGGRIVFGSWKRGLQVVDAGGGKAEVMTVPDQNREISHRLPHFLPGGRAVLFTSMPQSSGTLGRTEVVSLDSAARKVLIDDGMDARYVPSGHLVYAREGKLMAVPFDPVRLEVKGHAVPAVEGVLQAINENTTSFNSGAGQFDVSDSGSLIYAAGGKFPDLERQLAWVDHQGKAERIASLGKKSFAGLRLSPDGGKIVYGTSGSSSNVWVHDLASGTSSKLTTTGRVMHANWTPDGARIVFNFTEAGAVKLFWMPWDGSGGMEFFAQGSADLSPGSWTPDGSSFSFVENNPATGWDIWVLRMSDRKASPLIADSFMEGWPEFSRDGKWLAYASNLSGRFEVYVTPFPGPGRRIPISTGGGQAPMWAPNGRELYYWNLDTTKLMEVDVVTGSSFHAGPPRSLLDFPYDPSSPARNYDITPDGRRFLIPERVEFQPIEVNRLNLVQNWFEELKRLCPTGKK